MELCPHFGFWGSEFLIIHEIKCLAYSAFENVTEIFKKDLEKQCPKSGAVRI
jgi:hypothetical protein